MKREGKILLKNIVMLSVMALPFVVRADHPDPPRHRDLVWTRTVDVEQEQAQKMPKEVVCWLLAIVTAGIGLGILVKLFLPRMPMRQKAELDPLLRWMSLDKLFALLMPIGAIWVGLWLFGDTLFSMFGSTILHSEATKERGEKFVSASVDVFNRALDYDCNDYDRLHERYDAVLPDLEAACRRHLKRQDTELLLLNDEDVLKAIQETAERDYALRARVSRIPASWLVHEIRYRLIKDIPLPKLPEEPNENEKPDEDKVKCEKCGALFEKRTYHYRHRHAPVDHHDLCPKCREIL